MWKKVSLVGCMAFAVLLLRDYNDPIEEADNPASPGLAFITALRRHPPSLRVFRSLVEITLVLFCTSLSIYVWSRAAGRRVVRLLMFQPADKMNLVHPFGQYQRVSIEEDNDDDDNDDDDDDDDDTIEFQDKEAHNNNNKNHDNVENDAGNDEDRDGSSRSRNSTTNNAQHDFPTATLVAQAGLDMLLFIVVFLFLFTLSSAEGGRYIEGIRDVSGFEMMANFAAPIFPLALFVGAVVWSIFPWRKRRSFWIILSCTLQAPFSDVTFRCVSSYGLVMESLGRGSVASL